jgi:hypothetical protein
MWGLSRLLQSAGELSGRRRSNVWRQRVPRARPAAEELEERAVPTLLGQQLFPLNYPWNQNIGNAPVAANSAAIIAHIGSSVGIHPDWGDDSPSNGNSRLYGIPVNIVHGNSTPTVNVIIDDYPGESDIVPVPIPANAVIEGDYQNGPNPNGPGYGANQRGDSHLIIWDEDNNIAYELYGVARPSDPVTMDGVPTNGQWHAAQETVWYMNTDDFRSLGYTSADAAGLSILAGLARPDEGLPISQGGQGAIDHALRFTLPSGDVNPQYIYPASHVVSTSAGADNLPFGARLRLMNTPAVNAVISTLGPEAQIIAKAMQQYGLVLADIGSAMYVTGTSAAVNANSQIDLTWDMDDVLGLSALTAGDFQVVNLTPVVTGLIASSAPAGGTITITGQNFSGAADHITVFFGTTAASSVTVVDDAHITALIPSGSGTVNVTVQSGVNEIDPNNANDNVNNPIFGYGTSAISAADQFTYQVTGPYLSISGPTGATVGSPVSVTVTAYNASGTVATGYTGTVHFSSTDGAATLPSNYTFQASDSGMHTFLVTGAAVGPQILTVTDTGNSSITGGELIYESAAGPPPADLLVVANALTHSYEAYYRFVAAAYVKYLGRAATLTEANGWVTDLQNGLTDEELEAGFLGSAEYVSDQGGAGAGWITSLYQTVLGRTPTGAEVVGWLLALSEGWTTEAVAYSFTSSPERESEVVGADYQTYLGRTGTSAEIANWVNYFEEGGSNEDVVAAFVASLEFYDGHGGSPSAWLDGAYFEILGRHPGLGDFDAWMPVL